VNDAEGDYSDYLDARDLEGGPQPGRTDAAGWLVVSAAVALGVLVLGLVLLA
jgi:hypothetical protein